MDNTGKAGQRADIAIYKELCAADIDANATRTFKRPANGKDRTSQHSLVKNEQRRQHDDDKRCKGPGNCVEAASLGGATGNHHP